MSESSRSRVLRFLGLVLCAAMFLSLNLPTTASARSLRTDDQVYRAYVLRPKSVSRAVFAVKVKCTLEIDEDNYYDATWAFRGSKKSTVLKVVYRTRSGGLSRPTRVGYSKFATYMKKYKRAAVEVKYAWRGSGKKRYRYAQRITANYFAE